MDHFTLEALPARYGDCLLLHYGSDEKPGLILIDGGPGKVWEKSLQPRLKELAEARGAGFRINLMMVSHIDDDHVVGLVAFTGAWKAEKQAGRPWPFPVREVWHNSFERVSNAKDVNAVTASVTASAGADSIDEVDLEAAGIEDSEERRDALKVLQSVAKGKALRDDLEALAVPTNTGFDGKLVRPGKGPSVPYKLGPELTLHVAAPLSKQLDDLQKEFAKELKPEAALAAYTDGSVPNLSSIAALASFKGKTILLTGDARGDFLREGLRQEGLLDSAGKLHVDIFKLPHHGSDRNIDRDFFRDVTADHYVASADGTFVNPDRPTLEMLIGSRPKEARYVIHLTYEVTAIDAQRRKEWQTEREGELKKRAKKPTAPLRDEWDEARHGLGALFEAKAEEGYEFTVNAPPEAGRWPKIDLLDPISV
ncbi:MAG TPA: MBL fold metallo-hydrolase [Allosphingosinicella sp.]|nr:MBL fold metallo-hydrolase [Allosphingosinicella sp.]